TPWDMLGGEAIRHALTKGTEIEEFLEEYDHHHEHDHEECCGHDHHHEHDHEECYGHDHHHEHDHEECCGHDHHHEHDHEECCDHDHHHHHHADEVFTSWGKETVHKYTEDELDYLVKVLSETSAYGTILRSKGIVQMADGTWKQFDLVPEEYEVRDGQADYTGRICVIGTDLKEDELFKLFHI
ncbi:MAG: GTP-binding protein, partial [Dorea sp.]